MWRVKCENKNKASAPSLGGLFRLHSTPWGEALPFQSSRHGGFAL